MQKKIQVAIFGLVLLAVIAFGFKAGSHLLEWRLRDGLWKSVEQNDYVTFHSLLGTRNFTNLPSADKQSLLLKACGLGRYEMTQLLCEKGISLNCSGYTGATPLHRAATSNSPELVAYLLEMGCSVEQQDHYGNTPLSNAIWARRRRQTETVRILLDSGAIPFQGMLQPEPFKSAVRIGDTNIVSLLLSRMKDISLTPEEQNEVFSWAEEAGMHGFLSHSFHHAINTHRQMIN